MGMDIFGLKPKLKQGVDKPTIDWDKSTKSERTKYFENLTNYHNQNVGEYFRNNVWNWRPLANFIIELNKDWLSDEQRENLHNNSGYEFNNHQAQEIKNSLVEALNNGLIKKTETLWLEQSKISKKWNDRIIKLKKLLHKKAVKETSNTDIVPNAYPPELQLKWDKLSEQFDYTPSYPVSESNVKDFVKFLDECGGFKIC